MNIYEEIKNRNADNLEKSAMSIRSEDGTQRAYTYAQVFDMTQLFFQMLQGVQVHAGDRVAIMAESSPEWSIAYLAVVRLRATAVLLDASLERQGLLELLDKSDVSCIWASPKAIEKLGEGVMVPIFDLLKDPNVYLDGPPMPPVRAAADGNAQVSSIVFSSGTTQRASGILHNHDSLIHSAEMCISRNYLKRGENFLAILPNSHIYGLVCQVVGPLLLGADICFLEGLNANALAGAFREFHPSVLPAVPKIYELLKTQILQKVNADPKTKKLFEMFLPICVKLRRMSNVNLGKKLFKAVHDNFGGQLRILCSAGAPLSEEIAQFFYGLGFDILITYGATETGIPTIGNGVGYITTDSCGTPYPDIQVKISESGEILVKTPYMMMGYWRDEQATVQAFDAQGWFHSGDLGAIDAKGHVTILGRCKENIVLATGKKIAPDDIESAYAGIGGVRELVICGVPVENGGYDEVHAFVVAAQAQTEGVLVELKSKSMNCDPNMKLMGIHFVDEIPKTSLQKPKRFLLRQMIQANQPLVSQEKAPETPSHFAIIQQAVARVSNTNAAAITMGTKLFQELSIDSLSALDLACEIDERCGVRVDHILHQDMTISELVQYVLSPTAQKAQPPNTLYPIAKNQREYNVFCFIRRLFRSIYQVKVENDKLLPENSGYIICANHVSNFDCLYLTLNFTKDRFIKFCCMAKRELFRKNFLSKWITKIYGMVPIDRGGLVFDSMDAIRDKLKEKWGVLIHPEGTRSGDGVMGAFKYGAAVLAIEAAVPVVPAYIKGGFEVYPKWKKLPQLFNWKKMKKFEIEVIYGTPISPEGLSVDELMKAIEEAVTALSKGNGPSLAVI